MESENRGKYTNDKKPPDQKTSALILDTPTILRAKFDSATPWQQPATVTAHAARFVGICKSRSSSPKEGLDKRHTHVVSLYPNPKPNEQTNSTKQTVYNSPTTNQPTISPTTP